MNELRDKEGRTPGQVLFEASDRLCWPKVGKADQARWEAAAQAVLIAFGAQVSRRVIMDAWMEGYESGVGELHGGNALQAAQKYTDSVNLAPERMPLPYSAEDVAKAVIEASHLCTWDNFPVSKERAIAAAAKFCAPRSASREDDPEAPVYKKGHEPKTAAVAAHLTAASQMYPAPSGFSAMSAEPTLEEIRALAAKHGMELVRNKWKAPPSNFTPASLTAQLSAPDARFGSGK